MSYPACSNTQTSFLNAHAKPTSKATQFWVWIVLCMFGPSRTKSACNELISSTMCSHAGGINPSNSIYRWGKRPLQLQKLQKIPCVSLDHSDCGIQRFEDAYSFHSNFRHLSLNKKFCERKRRFTMTRLFYTKKGRLLDAETQCHTKDENQPKWDLEELPCQLEEDYV